MTVSALQHTPPAVEKAITLLQEGEKPISLRQNNILIVDRSKHGWVMVAKYEEDELADNLDDEKCLFRAEVRAGRKLKQRALTMPKRRAVLLGSPVGAHGRALPFGLGSMPKAAVLQLC